MAAAATATRRDRRFPRAWMGDSGDFSFSGLKTAARRAVTAALGPDADPAEPDGSSLPPDVVAELAWAFQDSVVDVLATRTVRAAAAVGARTVVMGGGVAANSVLRDRIAAGLRTVGIPLVVPRPGLCTDNGAMIGAAGFRRFVAGERAGPDLEARPSYKLATRDPRHRHRRDDHRVRVTDTPGTRPVDPTRSRSWTRSTWARSRWSATCGATACVPTSG